MPIAKLRRVLARARNGEPQSRADLDVLDAWVRAQDGKRAPKRQANAERLALVLRLQRQGMAKNHAIDAALERFPGASPGTVANHLNRAKRGSPKLLRVAAALMADWLEDDAGESSEARQVADEIAAEGTTAREDFKQP